MTITATDECTELTLDLDEEIACECMVCDLPLGDKHGPVEWRVHLHFPARARAPARR